MLLVDKREEREGSCRYYHVNVDDDSPYNIKMMIMIMMVWMMMINYLLWR